MREQLVVARGLPAQRVAERVRVDRNQEQAGLAEIMLSRRPGDLGGRREMNEAVAQIVAATPVDALPFGLAPGRGGRGFLDPAHGFPGLVLVWIFPETARWRRTENAAAR